MIPKNDFTPTPKPRSRNQLLGDFAQQNQSAGDGVCFLGVLRMNSKPG